MSITLKSSERDLLIRLLANLDDADLAAAGFGVVELDVTQELFDRLGDDFELQHGECHPDHEPSYEQVRLDAERERAEREFFNALDFLQELPPGSLMRVDTKRGTRLIHQPPRRRQ